MLGELNFSVVLALCISTVYWHCVLALCFSAMYPGQPLGASGEPLLCSAQWNSGPFFVVSAKSWFGADFDA